MALLDFLKFAICTVHHYNLLRFTVVLTLGIMHTFGSMASQDNSGICQVLQSEVDMDSIPIYQNFDFKVRLQTFLNTINLPTHIYQIQSSNFG